MLAALGLASGARRNELLALRWNDLDLATGQMKIGRALEQANGVVRIKSPKTDAGSRTITLPPATVAELRAHWSAQQEQRLSLGLGRSPADGYVLTGIDGGHLIPDTISGAWARAMDQIGMPQVRLHDLRHFHASALINAGMNITTVSHRLGHASPVITLGVYSHLIVGSDEKAAKILQAALTP